MDLAPAFSENLLARMLCLSVHAAALVCAPASPSDVLGRARSSSHHPLVARRCSDCNMGLFDGLASAFANDDTLGERESAPKVQAYSIKWIGPEGEETVSQALPGQKIQDLARQAGVAGKIKYNCGEGTCSSCDMLVNGDRVPACVAKAPTWDVEIEYGVKRSVLTENERQPQPSSRAPKPKAPASLFAGRFTPSSAAAGSAESAPAEAAPKKMSLEERLMAEEAKKKGAKKKGLFG